MRATQELGSRYFGLNLKMISNSWRQNWPLRDWIEFGKNKVNKNKEN